MRKRQLVGAGFHPRPRHMIIRLISFNLAVIAILGGFLYQKHLEVARIAEHAVDSVPVFGVVEETNPARTSIEQAQREVAAFTGHRQDIFTHIGGYTFLARVDGGDFIAEVCPESGRVLRTANARQAYAAHLSAEEGLEIAAAFLAQNGYAHLTLRHWRREAHQVKAQFVAERDGVLIYPKRVEIRVALDNGRVTGFSAVEYVAGQGAGEIPKAARTKEEATSAIPEGLMVEGYDMVVLADGLHYAFRTRAADGRMYLVYVCADRGEQQAIRLLVDDETGRFPL